MRNGYKDQQMDTIMHLLKPHVESIGKAENENVALAFKMYEIAKSFVEEVVDLDWQKSKKNQLAIIGGIMINTEGEKTDMFLPLMFELKCKYAPEQT
jgi:hypothetical protein